MKLFYSPSSPYSNKVRMAVRHAGLAVEEIAVVARNDPAELLAVNPLGRIPTLVDDGGHAWFDSPVIMHWIDRQTGCGLYPADPLARLQVEQAEAVADGVCDSLLEVSHEHFSRPPERVHQPWVDRQWSKVLRGLDYLESGAPVGDRLDAGDFALAATLRYLGHRWPGRWEAGRPNLAGFLGRFEAAFPDYAGFKGAGEAPTPLPPNFGG